MAKDTDQEENRTEVCWVCKAEFPYGQILTEIEKYGWSLMVKAFTVLPEKEEQVSNNNNQN